MASLLPISATPQENATALAIARLSDVPVPVRDVWNPDTCPEDLLPWLAWAFSVDMWDDAWTTDQKRAAIKASVEIHRHKGTPWAVSYALGVLGYEAHLQEWFDYGGDPCRFKVSFARNLPISSATIDRMFGVIQRYKRHAAHLDALVTPKGTVAAPTAVGFVRMPVVIRAAIHFDVGTNESHPVAVGVVRFGQSITATVVMPVVTVQQPQTYGVGVVRMAAPLGVTHE
ncbi:phage tail protein I [Desulfovibrio psychrotolerans]|uniref:Phage tail protein I n=1 Tax=Desulfovibrio psychrotolerans TaxID=415242 RepID=A0A7J0BYT0_9BACT|nr:phage tail protein I [Desulfovibrio psychrotolerans]GFM38322.1 hypothetical protein DSM19430T_30060 [Desulfovibrio psychrotolerans]